MSSLHIAITVDPYIPVPPRLYGGIERVVDFLVRGLVDRGHRVTLFAHPDSCTNGTLVPYGVPPHIGLQPRITELWQVGAKLWRHRRDFDLIHSFGRLAALLPVLPLRKLPKIQSYQRDEVPWKGIKKAVHIAAASLCFTACSASVYRARRLQGKYGGWWQTIFNGVDLAKYDLVPQVPPDAPLIFLGRLEPFKGAHLAIAIAKLSGRRLVIAGNQVNTRANIEYFECHIVPHIDGTRISYVGPIDDVQKNALLGSSAALLMPIQWEEPFGIVMAEALACGTPVIGFARGSVPEIVRDGVNGYVCQTPEEAAAVVDQLERIDRRAVRADCEARFSDSAIVSAYERLYLKMLGK